MPLLWKKLFDKIELNKKKLFSLLGISKLSCIFAVFKTKEHRHISSVEWIFYIHTLAISAKIKAVRISMPTYRRMWFLGRNKESEQLSLFKQLNFMQTKEMKLEQGMKYSSALSTSNRTKAISLSVLDASNIVDLANDLQGEEALEDLSLMLFDTTDEQMRGMALESILKFYANVRTLTKTINRTLKLD